MSHESIFKDITVLHARLFDHRPIVQGHINYFVKEFEEKRGDRESVRLKKTLDGVNSMNQMLPDITTVLADCLTDISQKASSCTQACTEICKREVGTATDFLVTRREKREKEWAEFMRVQVEKSAAVDRDFDTELTALKENYAKLEEKVLTSV